MYYNPSLRRLYMYRSVQVMNTYFYFLYFYSTKMDIGHDLHLNKYKYNCIEMSQQYLISVKHKYY
jgi:hypothetical protein